MEEKNLHSGLPFTTLTFGRSSGDTGYAQEPDQTNCFNFPAEGNQNPHVPPWFYCQQTPPNYVEFLAESGASEFQKEIIRFSDSPGSSGLRSPDGSLDMRPLPGNEGAILNNLTGSEYQIPSLAKFAMQNPNDVNNPAATGFPSTVPCSRSKKKAADADRRRRLRISVGLEALQELLPHPKKGGKAHVLDDIIDYVKHLQLQIKELSQRRLGGESSCTPFILLEGYGRYLLHDQMRNEPLEEMMGKLLEVNPLSATQLLESRGLFMMPGDLAEGLRPQN